MGSSSGFRVLEAIFMAMRLLQAVSLICIIGLTANFVKGMGADGVATPSAIVGTLVVACIAMLYILISHILHYNHVLPLPIATAADGMCLIAFVIASCVLGKPISHLPCNAFPKTGTASIFVSSLFTTSSVLDPSKPSCHRIKATWGLSIAAAILFFTSAVAAIALWNGLKRRADRPRKTMDCE
ncbi:hypothetical protein J3F83DRAFT_728301 [Trichoderma novae-zelandiae]